MYGDFEPAKLSIIIEKKTEGAVFPQAAEIDAGIDPDFDEAVLGEALSSGVWTGDRYKASQFATEDDYSEESFA